MKIKYFLGSLFAAAFAFTGCEDPDSLVNSESIVGKQLIVKLIMQLMIVKKFRVKWIWKMELFASKYLITFRM